MKTYLIRLKKVMEYATHVTIEAGNSAQAQGMALAHAPSEPFKMIGQGGRYEIMECTETTPNKNTNCLEGFKCPKCGQEDEFNIASACWANVNDDGVESAIAYEWDEESACVCTPCGHGGKVKDFK